MPKGPKSGRVGGIDIWMDGWLVGSGWGEVLKLLVKLERETTVFGKQASRS
jgi:hypothetical protein